MALGIINADQVLSDHMQLLQAVGVLRILDVSYVLQGADQWMSASAAGHKQPRNSSFRSLAARRGAGSMAGGTTLQNMCCRVQPDE